LANQRGAGRAGYFAYMSITCSIARSHTSQNPTSSLVRSAGVLTGWTGGVLAAVNTR
jgi:hypothetical protein